MPDGQDNQIAKQPTIAVRVDGLRLGGLAGGAMGLLGFALAVILGLAAGNSSSQIIYRALVAMFSLACVGGLAGAIAAGVIVERVQRIARERAAALEAEQADRVEVGRQGSPGGESDVTNEGPRAN